MTCLPIINNKGSHDDLFAFTFSAILLLCDWCDSLFNVIVLNSRDGVITSQI